MYAPIDPERGGPGRGLEALIHVRCIWMPTCRSSLAALLAIWQFLDRTRWNAGLSLKISLVSILLPELGERTFEANETHDGILLVKWEW